MRKSRDKVIRDFPCDIILVVDARMARHIEANGASIATALLRWHREMMCRYVWSSLQSNPKAPAWGLLQQFLDHYGITEDDLSMDTAYKIWQRWGWKMKGKNAQFLGQSRGKTGVKNGILSNKKTGANSPEFFIETLPAKEIEMVSARFITQYSTLYKRTPIKMPEQVRIYYYVQLSGKTTRQLAKTLGTPRSSISYAFRRVMAKAKTNPTFASMLADALPEYA